MKKNLLKHKKSFSCSIFDIYSWYSNITKAIFVRHFYFFPLKFAHKEKNKYFPIGTVISNHQNLI